jgi:hypothetical protein
MTTTATTAARARLAIATNPYLLEVLDAGLGLIEPYDTAIAIPMSLGAWCPPAADLWRCTSERRTTGFFLAAPDYIAQEESCPTQLSQDGRRQKVMLPLCRLPILQYLRLITSVPPCSHHSPANFIYGPCFFLYNRYLRPSIERIHRHSSLRRATRKLRLTELLPIFFNKRLTLLFLVFGTRADTSSTTTRRNQVSFPPLIVAGSKAVFRAHRFSFSRVF